jgi:deoxyribose-phosphate aldolase
MPKGHSPLTDVDAALARRALGLLDLTDLTDGCREDHVEILIQKALSPAGHVPAVCVWPQFVTLAAGRLKGKGIKVATVINFPKGGDDIERAIEDTAEAIDDGADEIDLVMPYRAFLAGDETLVRSMIGEVRDEIDDAGLLKVILETGAFPNLDSMRRAAELAVESGADFLKTSTGKSAVSATPEAVRGLLEVARASSDKVGVKVSGGVRSLEDVRLYLALADEILGRDAVTASRFRFGASSLHEALLATLAGTPGVPVQHGPY